MTANDLTLALRRLRRIPSFTATVVATLALGIGVTAALFGLVNGVLLRPLPYSRPDELIELKHLATRVEITRDGVSPGLADYYHARSRTIASMGVYTDRVVTFSDGDAPERGRILLTTPGLFTVLRPAAVQGRTLTDDDWTPGGEGRVVLSHDLWTRRYGGDPGILDRSIEIDRNLYRVVGVAEPGFHFPGVETQAWVAWGWPAVVASRAGLRGLAYSAVARLRPGVTVADAQGEVSALVRGIPDAFPEISAQRLDDMGFGARVIALKDAQVADVRVGLLLLQLSSLLLLVLTWANAANITLVRGARMRRDVAIAQALGAPGSRIVRGFAAEAFVLAGAAGLLGLALAATLLQVKFGLAPDDLPRLREVRLDFAVIVAVGVLAIAAGAFLGLLGFLSAARMQGVTITGTSTRTTSSRGEQRVREALVACQVALALALLVGSALSARSFWRLRTTPLGFRAENAVIFRVPLPPGEYSNYHASARVHHDILTRLRELPGVTAVEASHVSSFPLTAVPAHYQFRLVPSGQSVDREAAPWGRLGFATPGYFEVMGIPILSGRTFRPEDTGAEGHGVVLSHAMARSLFGDQEAVGRRIRWASGESNPDYTVVGVVGDVPGDRVESGPSRAFYFPHLYPPLAPQVTGVVHDYIPFDEMYVVRTALAPSDIMPAARRIVEAVDPKLVVVRPLLLTDLVIASRSRTRLTMVLLLAGAVTAVLLGVIGIHGMLQYTVHLRSQELAIRMALGASPGDVTGMVLRRGALQAGAGIVLGLGAAIALSRYLGHRLYEVSPTDLPTYAGMSALLFLVTLAASWLAARRARRIDPVSAMKVS